MSDITEKIYQVLKSYNTNDLTESQLDTYNKFKQIVMNEMLGLHKEILGLIKYLDSQYTSDGAKQKYENEICQEILKLSPVEISQLVDYELYYSTNRDFCESLLESASKYNYTQVVKLLCELGFRNIYPTNEEILNFDSVCNCWFIQNNNIELLDYYLSNNYKIHSNIYLEAINHNSTKVLDWCVANNIKSKGINQLITYALKNSKVKISVLDCLKANSLMGEYPLYWNSSIKYNESQYIRASKLEWLWANGFRWDKETATNCKNIFMLSKFTEEKIDTNQINLSNIKNLPNGLTIEQAQQIYNDLGIFLNK